MSVRWIILAILAAIAVLVYFALASQRKTMSAAERERDDLDQIRALQEAADKEVSHRPRVRAGTLPTFTTTPKGKP